MLSRKIEIQGRFFSKIKVVERGGIVTLLDSIFGCSGTYTVGFVNAHALTLASSDNRFFQDLLDCDYLLRDGVGVEVLMLASGVDPGLNLNGTDLIPTIVEWAAEKKDNFVLIGTVNPFLENAEKHLKSKGANVVAIEDGFQSVDRYIEILGAALDNSQGDFLVLLGMGMPLQESVAQLIKFSLPADLKRRVVIVCGGAIIDFMGGKVSRSPAWLRKLRLEWVYRLFLEPRRLWRRYLWGTVVLFGFLVGALASRIANKLTKKS